MELFPYLPKPKGDKKVLRDLKVRERTVQVPKNFTFVQSIAGLQECARIIKERKQFVFDLETTGLDWADYAVCIGIAVRIATGMIRVFIIPTNMAYAMYNFTAAEIREHLGDVFEDESISKIGHNVKFDQHHMHNTYGVDTNGITDDTMIAMHLLNENESHKLVDIAETWLAIDGWKIKQDGHFNVWPLGMAQTYLGKDCETTLLVYEFQQKQFAQLSVLKKLYDEVEIPNIQIAYEMEQYGIAWDGFYYDTVMKPEVQSKRAAARAKVQAVIGPVNLDSPSQVAAALFDGLRLPRINGNALDKKVLHRLIKYDVEQARQVGRELVIENFIEYRKYATLDKMFVQELPLHVVDGRIHTNNKTCGTRTGRWACMRPNMQQLPKAAIGPLIRRAFIPSKGNVLVTMDYGQIELRWLAHFSGDEKLIAAFASGEDIHTATCLLMFPTQITLAELKADKDHPLRVRAKTINFGILYGMGPQLLADTINAQARTAADIITVDDARALIKRWFDTFPKIKKYVNDTKVMVGEYGFVTTILGRKRRLPDAKLPDPMLSSMAERQAVNSRIQGSAADLLKVAQLKIRQFLLDTHYPFRMLLAVHDELVFEVPEAWLRHNEAALDELTAVMRNAMTLVVPVVVSVDLLHRWGDKIHDDDFFEEAV